MRPPGAPMNVLAAAAALWRTGVERHGAPGIAGALLLVAALGMAATFHQRLASRRDTLRAELAAVQSGATQRVRLLPEGPASQSGQLRAFFGRFPKADSAARELGRVNEAAAASGIALLSGEYRMERKTDDRLLRYRVVLPVQGSYSQLRSFVDRVLVDVPTAALDEVEMRRESSPGAPIQARLRFTLYLQSGS